MRHVIAFLLLSAAAAAQTGPAGHWEGVLDTGGNQIPLTFDLAQNAKGEWTASMGSQKMTGMVVKDLSVNGKSVKCMAVEIQMAMLDLTLGENGKLAGTISNPRGGALHIEFARTGEPNVQLPAPMPAVSKDLEGDWAGTIQTPGSDFQIEIHFKNQPDNTLKATIDIPMQNAMDMPIDSVKQTGDKVEFGLKIAHASFQGTLNKDRTELTGQLGHDEQNMPVKLKKK